MPIPERGKTSRKIKKLDETEHNTAETSMNPIQITRIVFGLYFTVNPPNLHSIFYLSWQ